MTGLPKTVNDALERFSTLGPTIERSEIAPLLTTAGAAPAARDARFAVGVDKFVHHIKSQQSGRVESLSLLWRLTSVVAMREHRRSVAAALKSGVPEFSKLPTDMADADDRRHFADALASLEDAWLPNYIANALVHERDGEKARESLARALVANVPNLSKLLNLVGTALAEISFEQQDPAVGRARRFAAILDALRFAIWNSELDTEPGEAYGEALSKLVSDTLARRPVGDRGVSILASRAVLDFLIMVVRLHGTLAADPDTYLFVDPLRRSLGTSTWPSELAPELGRAANQLLEQLVFLVRLKKPDDGLRRLYVSMIGEGVAKSRLTKLADEADGIDQASAYWLRTGSQRRVLPTQSAIEETAVSAVDRDLGLALREADIVKSTIAAISGEAVSAAEFHSPRLGEELKDALDRVDRLSILVEAAARRRGLVLRGSMGEVVEFSPLHHEPGPGVMGARTVRIKTRIVERELDGKTLGIIVKGDVDRA